MIIVFQRSSELKRKVFQKISNICTFRFKISLGDVYKMKNMAQDNSMVILCYGLKGILTKFIIILDVKVQTCFLVWDRQPVHIFWREINLFWKEK